MDFGVDLIHNYMKARKLEEEINVFKKNLQDKQIKLTVGNIRTYSCVQTSTSISKATQPSISRESIIYLWPDQTVLLEGAHARQFSDKLKFGL